MDAVTGEWCATASAMAASESPATTPAIFFDAFAAEYAHFSGRAAAGYAASSSRPALRTYARADDVLDCRFGAQSTICSTL